MYTKKNKKAFLNIKNFIRRSNVIMMSATFKTLKMSDNNLQALRSKLDKIDAQILKLLNERMDYALQIAQTKKTNNKAIYDEARENVLIENILKAARLLNLDEDMVKNIWTHILSGSRKKQKEI